MVVVLLIIANGIIGSVIGRILFRKRLGNSIRYEMGRDYTYSRGVDVLIDTEDLKSAQTYGLWSVVVWPITLAFFSIQAPTPDEKRSRRTKELESATKALEALAKEYDLKVKV